MIDCFTLITKDFFSDKCVRRIQLHTGRLARAERVINRPRSLEGEGVKLTPYPTRVFLLKFCCLTNCQKFWYNCSLFVDTSFDPN